MNTDYSNGMISMQGYTPMRKDPHERAEMVSMVLFGEHVHVLDDEGKWLYVKHSFDSYEGWVDKKTLDLLENEAAPGAYIAISNTSLRNIDTNQNTFIPAGSIIPDFSQGLIMGSSHFEISNPEHFIKPGSVAIEELFKYVETLPYLWGGRCGYGFDCSGLTQFLVRAMGKALPRDSGDQAAIGSTLSFINEAKTGDLAFFDDTEGLIHHVGMVIDKNRIIHASGSVRIDRLDQQGIYNVKLKKYTHQLRVLKRV